MDFEKGDIVLRLGSSKDYTVGRTGEVVEVLPGDRYQVKWTKDRDGDEMRPIKTKVNGRFLKKVK